MVTPSRPDAPLLAVAVGNTRARWARFLGRESDPAAYERGPAAVGAIVRAAQDSDASLVALASVNEPLAREIEIALAAEGRNVARIGRDLVPPLRHSLDDASTLGIDRVLDAFAAFRLIESACVVIDAGTAITVDFVDGEGTFHGGAIAPGVGMMLRALHEQTSALPSLRFAPQDPARGPFGRDTAHAMQLGVAAAARGLARDLVERFAEHYEAYPRVVATGGDAAALFEDDGLIERIIPDLQLIGIQRAVEEAAAAEED